MEKVNLAQKFSLFQEAWSPRIAGQINPFYLFTLLQQDQIAGLGNGYLQDILFKAWLHPARKASEISEQERQELYRAIREVIGEAIRPDGSQFEVDLFNHPGSYHRLMTEHMKGHPCCLA
jgi:formamidopyrimidine-DNA glycosylase